MDLNGLHKSMAHFPSACWSSTFNTQMLLYYDHSRHFDDRVLNILQSHNIQYFILKSGYSVYGQPNYNGTNLKLNNLYGDEIIY